MSRKSVTITAVTPTRSDPGLCRIKVGRRVFGPIRRDEAERLGIRPGSAWTASIEREVERIMQRSELRRHALAALAKSPRSRAELSARLRRRGGEPALVESTLDALAADGWLDDRRSAETRARVLRRGAPIPREALDGMLEFEGYRAIDRRSAIDADPTSDLDAVRREVRRAVERGDATHSIARRLARRGFDADIIREALARHGRELEDDSA